MPPLSVTTSKTPASVPPVVVSASPPKEEDLASLTSFVGSGFISLSSQDSKGLSGTTDTESYYFSNFYFRQYWKEWDLISEVHLGLHRIKLASPMEGKHSQESFTLPSYGLRLEKGIKTYGNLFFGIHYQPIFFMHSRVGDEFKIASTQMGTASLGVKKDMLQYKKLLAHVSVAGLGIIPQKTMNTNFKSGWGYKLGLGSEYRNESWALTSEISYQHQNIDTNLSELEYKSFFASIGFTQYFE